MLLELNSVRFWPAVGASVLLLAACGGGGEESAEAEVREAQEQVEEAADTDEAAAEDAGEAVQEMADAAEAAVDDAADEAGSAMDSMREEAEQGMADAGEAVQDAADAVTDAAGDAMDSASDMAGDAMAAMQGAADEVAEGAEEVVDDAQAMASNVVDDVAGPVVHEIRMLNGDPENPRERMVFRPDLVVAKPGDVIKFIPTDPSHQSSSVDGMLPAGAEGWQGKVNEALEYTLTEPGVYGYKCVPHYAGGMVGLVVVQGDGMMDNVADAKKVRQVGLAKRRFDAIWTRAEAEYLN